MKDIVAAKMEIHEAIDQLQTAIELWWKMVLPQGKVPDSFLAGITIIRNKVNALPLEQQRGYQEG